MGEGEKRSPRTARLSEKLGGSGLPPEDDAPYMPRTTTLDDPLTTSLLAEVARRSRTLDVSPEQIAEAQDLDVIDPIAAPAAAAAVASTRIPRGASSAADPDDPA
jgi:hypothetical protein